MENQLYIIDQHAAHERILYEKYLNQFKSNTIHRQKLLTPIILDLNIKQIQIINDNIDLFINTGFDISLFGDNSIILREMPIIFDKVLTENYLLEIIDSLETKNVKDIYDLNLNKIATFACKSAVKANDKLSFLQAKSLVDQLFELENPFTCPHGRPTIISISQNELEKKFKRIQD